MRRPLGVTTTVKCLIAVGPPVRGAPDEYQILVDLDPGGLIELEFSGGVRRWVSVAQLQDELRASGTHGEGGVLELPPTFGASVRLRIADRWIETGSFSRTEDPGFRT
jgi:hypothetical protein